MLKMVRINNDPKNRASSGARENSVAILIWKGLCLSRRQGRMAARQFTSVANPIGTTRRFVYLEWHAGD